jgi:hypothetical protein
MIKHCRPEARKANKGAPIRTVIFKDVGGLRYTLRVWDSGDLDTRGCSYLGYELREGFSAHSVTIFEGEDFAGSPMHADDSDETMKGLLAFLTLRPGDTDSEYFAKYTEPQHSWCIAHAEDLAMAVLERFGE